MKPAGYQSSWRKGFIGICALNMMTRGQVYGNMVASELFELSDHQWKPGAGAIYPAMHKLVRDGLAVARKEDGRTVYAITKRGQSLLAGIKQEATANQRYGLDFGRMWLTMLGPDLVTEHLLRRLKLNISTVEEVLAGRRFSIPETEAEYLLNQALGELRRGASRLEALHRGRRAQASSSGSRKRKEGRGGE